MQCWCIMKAITWEHSKLWVINTFSKYRLTRKKKKKNLSFISSVYVSTISYSEFLRTFYWKQLLLSCTSIIQILISCFKQYTLTLDEKKKSCTMLCTVTTQEITAVWKKKIAVFHAHVQEDWHTLIVFEHLTTSVRFPPSNQTNSFIYKKHSKA